MTKSLALLFVISFNLYAEGDTSTKSTNSAGMTKNEWNKVTPLTHLKETVVTAETKEMYSGKTREEVISLKRVSPKNKMLMLSNETNNNVINSNASGTNTSRLKSSQNYHHSFSIYNAYSQLIEDFDVDGFYQTFSVTFDADVYDSHGFDHANVYAELYLSRDGGDWVHYFTTDDFNIYGESEDDEYEVYTTLSQGYLAGNYDVLIDLYEVGYSDIVATISSDDTNELYALPLESSNYDPNYVQTHSTSHGHGGSQSFILIAGLLSLFGYRSIKSK